jgi:type II secretory pathway pseudopilin PulG
MLKNNQGFTFIEALVSVAIIGFVIISILNGFTYQQLSTKNISSKNLAISLAETRLEEFLKFPGSELTDGTTIDYIVQGVNSLNFYSSDPNQPKQLRRTTVISSVGNLKSIAVVVEYGKTGNTYPFRVSLSTRRGG